MSVLTLHVHTSSSSLLASACPKHYNDLAARLSVTPSPVWSGACCACCTLKAAGAADASTRVAPSGGGFPHSPGILLETESVPGAPSWQLATWSAPSTQNQLQLQLQRCARYLCAWGFAQGFDDLAYPEYARSIFNSAPKAMSAAMQQLVCVNRGCLFTFKSYVESPCSSSGMCSAWRPVLCLARVLLVVTAARRRPSQILCSLCALHAYRHLIYSPEIP
jgi:hypothetical protein